MARKIEVRAATPSPNAAQKAELCRVLARIPAFAPLPVRDVGENPPAGLIAALECVFGHGLQTGTNLRAYRCRERWLIDSRIMLDQRRLAE